MTLIFRIIVKCVLLANLTYGIIDEDNDGLSDVWEELFSAQSLLPSDDNDGDTYNNLEECIAGTDPLDGKSRPLINLLVNQNQPDLFEISFDSLRGKFYELEHSQNLSTFKNLDLRFNGNNSKFQLSIDRNSEVRFRSAFVASFWSDIEIGPLDNLSNDARFPNSPSGIINLDQAAAPSFLASGYGGNIKANVVSPANGDYRFYLSSGGPARLYVGNRIRAEVFLTQAGLRPGDWEVYDTQRSIPIALTTDTPFDISIRYLSSISLQHVELAWSGPGIEGIQKISQENLSFTDVLASNTDMGAAGSPAFFKLKIAEEDQDGDGIPDWEEFALSKHKNILFFDAQTTSGISDSAVLSDSLFPSTGSAPLTPEISLVATDAAAFENNFPSTTDDDGAFIMTRTGSQAPLTVKICLPPLTTTGNTATVCDGNCCSLVGSAGDESAEPADYQIIDEEGNVITDEVFFEFGEIQKKFRVKAINDSINEYPETLNIAVEKSDDNSYTLSETVNGASIQIFDLPDSQDNLSVFTAPYSEEDGVTSAASGSVTVTINGPRTEIKIWTEFTNLGSNLSNAHFHKANIGNLTGDVVHGLSAETIASMTQEQADLGLPLTEGALTAYTWSLLDSAGAISSVDLTTSKQVLIDSLFQQNGETPLYFNLHTDNRPGGEIWSFFQLSEGSIEDPGQAAPPAEINSADYPLLTGELLEVDVRRFLNQATFGATDEHTASLLNTIHSNRETNSTYHRHEAFEKWLDDQIDPVITPQSYLLDYMLASNFQHFTLSGFFDPSRNVHGNGTTPERPEWPHVIRTSEKPEHWYLSAPYPITKSQFSNASSSPRIFNPHFGIQNIRTSFWQLHLNGRDQLRHKMGFALQQIVVASNSDQYIEENANGSINYQDMINAYAFSHYRDILGTVNYSPIMGRWLSSMQNQKSIDLDNDGLFDTFPDENLARENMQLFSIGLFDIWSDGTLKLTPEGLPKQTYTNEDIKAFSRVITGLSLSYYRPTTALPTWGGVEFEDFIQNDFFASSDRRGHTSRGFLYPMKMFGEFHSLGIKEFAGTTINNTGLTDLDELATADFEQALDWLAGKPNDGKPDFDMVNSHTSTPAFISKLLIQRFTTSNPSREYLHRVATVFKNSEGHLGNTIKAILLDPEIRNIDLNEKISGLKKSPLESFMQMARSLEARTGIPLSAPTNNDVYEDVNSDYSNPDIYLSNFGYPDSQLALHERNVRFRNTGAQSSGPSGLQMNHMNQDTVFNYYLPDHQPAGVIGNAGLLSPEMQILTEPNYARNVNYFNNAIYNENGLDGEIICYNVSFQREVLGSTANTHRDHMRLPLAELANEYYPVVQPDSTAERTSESLADEVLMDALDLRLTNGLFKIKYPYDKEDNLPDNPREIIIDHITESYDSPFNSSNSNDDRLKKIQDAIYLLTASSEYQIKK